MYVTEGMAQANASAYCARHGGNLVTYRAAAKQLLVENYFKMGELTSYYYWVGVRRAATSSPYEFVAGSRALPQGASNAPYAHWSWYHSVANRSANYDCVIAQEAFKYELYQGVHNSSAQLADSRYYNANPANQELAYGWNGYPCSGKLHFVCEAPASAFPCHPPPPPPLAPSIPPPPPRPPKPDFSMGSGGGVGDGSCEHLGPCCIAPLNCRGVLDAWPCPTQGNAVRTALSTRCFA